jgi:hypothetical protein
MRRTIPLLSLDLSALRIDQVDIDWSAAFVFGAFAIAALAMLLWGRDPADHV